MTINDWQLYRKGGVKHNCHENVQSENVAQYFIRIIEEKTNLRGDDLSKLLLTQSSN